MLVFESAGFVGRNLKPQLQRGSTAETLALNAQYGSGCIQDILASVGESGDTASIFSYVNGSGQIPVIVGPRPHYGANRANGSLQASYSQR